MQARLASLVGVSFAGAATPAQGMAPAKRRSLGILGSSLILLALFASSAKAVQTIPVNPGPIGGPANEFGWETDQDQYTFDIVFTDSKALQWGPGTQIFRLLAPLDAGQYFFGAFLDGAGDPILGTAFVGRVGTDGDPVKVAVAVLDEQVVFRGMRFIAADQDPPGPGWSLGRFEIRWVSDAPVVVPEPSTALLLGLGLLGVGIRRRRAADPQPLKATRAQAALNERQAQPFPTLDPAPAPVGTSTFSAWPTRRARLRSAPLVLGDWHKMASS